MLRRTTQRFLSSAFDYLVLSCASVLFLIPLVWMIVCSLKIESQIFSSVPIWIPRPINWANYRRAVTYFPFFRYLLNTMVICIMNVVGSVISCSLVAYGLAHIKWRGREFFFILMISTLMLPRQVRMIPLYVIFKKLGWINTYLPLIIPSFVAINAFYSFLLRQFFLNIPIELSDAARIDGVSELNIYLRIVLPLSKAALFTVALFEFLSTWNDFLGPLVYLNDITKYTLSIGLKFFQGNHESEFALLMAAATLITVPIIILFFFTQRTFIEGIAKSGLKE